MTDDLITLEDALDHLRIDSGDDEGLVELYIKAASASIRTYLGDGVYSDVESETIRDDVKVACMILVGDMYRYREGESPNSVDSRYGYGYLPARITAMLFPYRDLVSL